MSLDLSFLTLCLPPLECRSWLSPCQTSWQCGSDYEYRQAQIYPPPPCPYPGIYFVPPPEPGMCQYNVEAGQCQFQGERELNALDFTILTLASKMYVSANSVSSQYED